MAPTKLSVLGVNCAGSIAPLRKLRIMTVAPFSGGYARGGETQEDLSHVAKQKEGIPKATFKSEYSRYSLFSSYWSNSYLEHSGTGSDYLDP